MPASNTLENLWNKIRWTIYLPIYDWIAGIFAPWRKQSIEQLNLNPNDKILISGAGSGLDLPFLKEAKSIAAVDITPAMLYLLRKKANKLHLNVDSRTMDAMKLEFPDDHFDAVILHLILAVIPDPVKCLKEAERVLKPGGKIAVFDKFVPEGEKSGLLREFLNFFLKILATSVNRDINEIVKHTNLQKEKDRPAAWSGLFRLILLKKPT
ncbi:MAG: class I SAM-dependent methyltransferase [Saprospiraceae bacterium]